MKIVTVVGARPQFVKAAVVSRALRAHASATELIVHTGQHYDTSMSDIFFEEMEIPPPAYHLGVGGLSHGAMTGQMLEKIEEVLLKERPDWVLVYGDTNSTLAGALAAAKLGIPVAHVEAGLRSHNLAMPEELNRILTDRLSRLLFVPTENARQNLLKEGYAGFPATVAVVGDVMYDAALHYSRNPRARERRHGEGHALVTLHRASNTDDSATLAGLVEALNTIARDRRVICPLHPRTRKKIAEAGLAPAFDIIGPVGYFEMLDLLQTCRFVMTDSGGLQKEAYFFGKPCLTLRTETEWTELVDLGCNVVAGVRPADVVDSARALADRVCDFSARPYGHGDAGGQIARQLLGGSP